MAGKEVLLSSLTIDDMGVEATSFIAIFSLPLSLNIRFYGNLRDTLLLFRQTSPCFPLHLGIFQFLIHPPDYRHEVVKLENCRNLILIFDCVCFVFEGEVSV